MYSNCLLVVVATMIYGQKWRDAEVRRNFGVLGLSFPIFRRNCGLWGDCNSGTALRLAHSRRRTVPGVYPIIIPLFYQIFRRSSSLAGSPRKPLTLLSIFVTGLSGGEARCVRLTIVFLFPPGLLRNSVRHTDRDTREVLVTLRNSFSLLLCS